MDTCIECASTTNNNTDCKISWGKCGHAFHTHCIMEWLKSKSICPLDTKKWEYKPDDNE